MRVSPLDHTTAVFKALGDPTRLRILALLLEEGELCVCDVEAILGISQSGASRHLRLLRDAAVLTVRRDGSWVHYRITRPAHPIVVGALRELRRSLEGDAVIEADRARAAARSSVCEPGPTAKMASTR